MESLDITTQLFLLMLFITTASCGAILSNALFFRHSDTPLHRIGTTFLIPLLMMGFGFIFEKHLPLIRVIFLSEFLMTLTLGIMLLLHLKLSQSTAWFLSTSASIVGCTLLFYADTIPFLAQMDLKIYAIAAFIGSMLPVMARPSEKKESIYLNPYLFLGGSQLLALFSQTPALAAGSVLLKAIFYFQVVRYFATAIHDEIMEEVNEARKIQKDFSDELRKEVKKQVFYMEQSQKKMAQISQTDALTGALNRKGILDAMDRLVDDRHIQQFSVLIFDIDKFKGINDTLGHVIGDKCLKGLCQIARSNLRDEDYLGRYGGDEFIIALPNTGTEAAFAIAERFRQRVQETDDPHYTISIGISTFPKDGRTHKQLLEYADQGLYISKEKGRNAVSRKPS